MAYECGIPGCLHASRKMALQCNRNKIALANITKQEVRIVELDHQLSSLRGEHESLKEKLAYELVQLNEAIEAKAEAEGAVEDLQMSLNGANGQSKALEAKLETANSVIHGYEARCRELVIQLRTESPVLSQEEIDKMQAVAADACLDDRASSVSAALEPCQEDDDWVDEIERLCACTGPCTSSSQDTPELSQEEIDKQEASPPDVAERLLDNMTPVRAELLAEISERQHEKPEYEEFLAEHKRVHGGRKESSDDSEPDTARTQEV